MNPFGNGLEVEEEEEEEEEEQEEEEEDGMGPNALSVLYVVLYWSSLGHPP
jgi:hypothetical protein